MLTVIINAPFLVFGYVNDKYANGFKQYIFTTNYLYFILIYGLIPKTQ